MTALARCRHAVHLLVLCALAAVGCAGGLREIPRGQHPMSGGAQPIAVDSAPPPALIDSIGPAPTDDCVWADGQWLWRSNRWQWAQGAWVRVAEGCYYADALMVWVPTQTGKGILFYTEGHWYRDSGVTCPAPGVCTR